MEHYYTSMVARNIRIIQASVTRHVQSTVKHERPWWWYRTAYIGVACLNDIGGVEQCLEIDTGIYNIGGIWSIPLTFLRHLCPHMMYNQIDSMFHSPEHQGLK